MVNHNEEVYSDKGHLKYVAIILENLESNQEKPFHPFLAFWIYRIALHFLQPAVNLRLTPLFLFLLFYSATLTSFLPSKLDPIPCSGPHNPLYFFCLFLVSTKPETLSLHIWTVHWYCSFCFHLIKSLSCILCHFWNTHMGCMFLRLLTIEMPDVFLPFCITSQMLYFYWTDRI